MLKNIYLFPSFHEIKTSNSASQNPQVPTKTLHWKKLKNTRRTKWGVREKGRRGKHTHHLCHESECRRLFGTLEQHSTTHRLLSINNPDRLLPGTSPEKKFEHQNRMRSSFFSHQTLSPRNRFTSEASFRTRTCSWRACGILWPPSPGEASSIWKNCDVFRVWYVRV